MPRTVPPAAVVLATAVLLIGCGGASQVAVESPNSNAQPPTAPRVVQPGAPGQATRTVSADQLRAEAIPVTEADVRFMQGMIGHHAQALDMTALIAERTERQDLRLLGQRIEISQKSEIQLMQKWLRDRDKDVPEATAHHMVHGHTEAMPGMLTAEQMQELEDATGDEFYVLWLEYMIQHHEGAITMVAELMASEGAAQETDIYRFADAVVEDQSMEIRRMRQMIEALR